jgi:elongation factor Ts
MEITTDMIKMLREKTGAGMMDCKRALEASAGDMNAAIEYLRKKGAAVAQKRSDRSAKEGVIVAQVDRNGTRGVIVEINCETDFVARSEDFVKFAHAVLEGIQRGAPRDVASVAQMSTASGKTVGDLFNDLAAKVGEKIEIRRFKVLESVDGLLSSYTHLGNKIGVLVEISGVGSDEDSLSLGRNIALQIAAMNPLVVSRDQIQAATVERELGIYRTQAQNEGKPPQIAEKIALGKLEKFYQEVCLLEQIYIRDSGKTVRDFVSEASAKTGRGDIAVRQFERFHLGEEYS